MVGLKLEPVFTDLSRIETCSLSDDLRSVWKIITKVKDSVPSGYRLENLSWRLWYVSESSFHCRAPRSDNVTVCSPESLPGGFVEVERIEPSHSSTENLTKQISSYSTLVKEICENDQEPVLSKLTFPDSPPKRFSTSLSPPKKSDKSKQTKTPASIKQGFIMPSNEQGCIFPKLLVDAKNKQLPGTSGSTRICPSKTPKGRETHNFGNIEDASIPEEEESLSPDDSDDSFFKNMNSPSPSLPPDCKSLLSLLISNDPSISARNCSLDYPKSPPPLQGSPDSTTTSNEDPNNKFIDTSRKVPEFHSPYMIW